MHKTILITGCSSGFGKLTAELLLERGHRVIAGLRGGEARLQEVFGPEFRARFGANLVAIDLPMEKPDRFPKVAALVRDRFDGKLDVLVNNAGFGFFGALE